MVFKVPQKLFKIQLSISVDITSSENFLQKKRKKTYFNMG